MEMLSTAGTALTRCEPVGLDPPRSQRGVTADHQARKSSGRLSRTTYSMSLEATLTEELKSFANHLFESAGLLFDNPTCCSFGPAQHPPQREEAGVSTWRSRAG